MPVLLLPVHVVDVADFLGGDFLVEARLRQIGCEARRGGRAEIGRDQKFLEFVQRCFIHLTHAELWRALTGEAPPTKPPTAAQYTAAGLPWFDYYGGGTALAGSPILAGLESVAELGKKKGETPLPENEPIHGETIVKLRAGLAKHQVREGRF